MPGGNKRKTLPSGPCKKTPHKATQTKTQQSNQKIAKRKKKGKLTNKIIARKQLKSTIKRGGQNC